MAVIVRCWPKMKKMANVKVKIEKNMHKSSRYVNAGCLGCFLSWKQPDLRWITKGKINWQVRWQGKGRQMHIDTGREIHTHTHKAHHSLSPSYSYCWGPVIKDVTLFGCPPSWCVLGRSIGIVYLDIPSVSVICLLFYCLGPNCDDKW